MTVGEVERHTLEFWGEKIVGDPEMMPRDATGRRPGDVGYGVAPLTTYCNVAVQRICRGLGYEDFAGMVANQIHEHASRNWVVPYGTDAERANAAHIAASIGDLALAAQKGEPHGHVAIIAPSRHMVFSGKWGFYAPLCYNVGARNGIMGVNYAFKSIPDFFVLGRVVS